MVIKELKPLIKRLSAFNWPAGCKAELPEVVAQSYKNFDTFWDKRNAWLERIKYEEAEDNLLYDFTCIDRDGEFQYILFDQQLESKFWRVDGTEAFIFEWFRSLCERLSNWQGWSGSLKKYVFHENHPEFHKIGQQVAQDYGLDISYWNDYLQHIEK